MQGSGLCTDGVGRNGLSLIVTISISSFAQYFFGIVNRLLLTADQRGYIQYNAQTLAVVCNTADSVDGSI